MLQRTLSRQFPHIPRSIRFVDNLLADDLFEYILHGDHTGDGAILINHDNRKEKRLSVDDLGGAFTKKMLKRIPRWVYELCAVEEDD